MDKNNDLNNNIEVIIGDSTNLKFSEVGDYMGDLRPKDIKGSKKNIIIPTNKKKVEKPVKKSVKTSKKSDIKKKK